MYRRTASSRKASAFANGDLTL